MSKHNFLGALVLAATSFASTATFADTSPQPAAAAPCALTAYGVTSVTPYRVEERRGRAAFSRLGGANVYVRAEAGLTKEWLQLTLGRHVTAMHGTTMRDCPLDLNDVIVSVDSAGAGFKVRIAARDEKNAEEVLRRAHLLLG